MKKKILIADDEPNVLLLVKLALESDFEIIEAVDGEEALRRAQNEEPDLILLDVMMPRINGFEVCQRLKSNPSHKHIPIIILSAKAQEQDIIQGLDIGADMYLTKPFDPKKLEDLVCKFIG
jgi:two-component system, OmpR family, alkaline phosphatase synthesis response regulator PhoP